MRTDFIDKHIYRIFVQRYAKKPTQIFNRLKNQRQIARDNRQL